MGGVEVERFADYNQIIGAAGLSTDSRSEKLKRCEKIHWASKKEFRNCSSEQKPVSAGL